MMEIREPAIGAAIASFALTMDGTMMGPPVMRIVSAGETLLITFPQDITLEDFDRMTIEIRAALDQAELRGEQKALAFIRGEGSLPLGTVRQPELNDEPLESRG